MNAETETPATTPRIPGETVRLVDDEDRDRTFTITDISPVGKTGKQFRCTLMNDKTGEVLTGIAPSRIADPYKAAKVYQIGETSFTTETGRALANPHPALALTPWFPKDSPDGKMLFDLVKNAAVKGTDRAHAEVIIFCTRRILNPVPHAPTFAEKFAAFFTGNTPGPDARKNHLLLAVAKLHASLIEGKD